MGKVIAVANQKGGVGKTTTAVQLGAGLAASGFSVLFIDMDSQCNASFILDADTMDKTVLEVMKGDITAQEAIQACSYGDVIPGSPFLGTLEQVLPPYGREYVFRKVLEPIRGNYQYIVVDCPPTLSVDTVNVLTASDFVVIPAIADIFSLQGVGQLFSTVETVREYCNPDLKISGILMTRYNSRLTHTRELRKLFEDTASQLGTKVYATAIRESVAIREATTVQKSIFDYGLNTRQAEDYAAFLKEFLADQGETVTLPGETPEGNQKGLSGFLKKFF